MGPCPVFRILTIPSCRQIKNEFYQEWKTRHPSHGFSEIVWEYMAALDVWKYGVEKAGSVNSEKVFKALKSSESVPHAFGPAKWWGADVFGLDNLLVPSWPITEVKNGKPVIVAQKSLFDWLEQGNNKAILDKYLKKWKLQ